MQESGGGLHELLPRQQGLSTPRKIAIAGLVALGVLLTAAFFLVYFGENESDAVELTAVAAGAAERPDAAIPLLPQMGALHPS